jgi:hypothetical protein
MRAVISPMRIIIHIALPAPLVSGVPLFRIDCYLEGKNRRLREGKLNRPLCNLEAAELVTSCVFYKNCIPIGFTPFLAYSRSSGFISSLVNKGLLAYHVVFFANPA